ncbi:MAG TPA: class I SAM-dependent methyltransferase [Acetobacteraceae bacterium]|nr:class I SAM-dependent methyltransferase [Acetobacteraceae bacterium]
MARWDDGYVTDVVYTANFYREITPAWLAMSSLLLGHRPPDLTRPFTYADLGCGNGFSALIVAATFPQAEVWGFDFNPAHVEFARTLATAAGLANAHFAERSFADLAAASGATLPDFNMMVSHGVLSWISPENRRHLIATIARRLKPGGLAYLSYNVTTGWSAMVPVRTMMRMLAVASPERTDLAAPGVLDFVDRLRQAGAAFFPAHPSLESRLADIRKQDARYIAHEYLNQDWHPLMFADIASDMAEAKCRYIGSATLAENIDNISVPANVVPILAETRDPVLRETIRDVGCAQSFRRDLFRKGFAPMPPAEQQANLEAMTLAGLGRQVPEGGITFATPVGNVTGLPAVYEPLLAVLENDGTLSIGAARQAPALAGRSLMELMQAFTLLVAGGYAHPILPGGISQEGHDASHRLNLAIAGANRNAADLTQLAAPLLGSAFPSEPLETLVVGELLAGRPADIASLAAELLAALGRTGRGVQRDGQPVTDPVDANRIMAEAIANILERRLPVLQRLGVA